MENPPARSTDTGKPMEDVASDQFNGDKQNLIGAGQNEVPTEGSEVSPLQMEDKDTPQGCLKKAEGLKVIVVSTIVFSIAVTVALIVTIIYAPPQVPPHGAVATDHQTCSKMGRTILQKGGAAVDAAVASGLCMCVVHPHLVGIGGGGFMVVRHHKDRKTVGVDFRETAPRASTADMFKNKEAEQTEGANSVAVPGTLRGLFAAHNAHGKLSWYDVVHPAAELAINGFKVSKSLAANIQVLKPVDFQTFPGLEALVKGNGTKLYVEGDTMKLPKLGEFLEAVGKNSIEHFYNDATSNIATEIGSLGGILSKVDLQNYTAKLVEPIVTNYKSLQLETMPAPSAGPMLALIMNILHGYDFKSSNVSSGLAYHRIVEAMKFGFAHVGYLGDPGVDLMIQIMNNKTYAATLREKISDTKTNDAAFYKPAGVPSMQQGTGQISVFGPNEDMASLTISVGSPWGSKVVTSNQIVLNNHMSDFDLPTAGAQTDQNNLIGPGKRPFSYMTPTIAHTVGRPCATRMAVGASGGDDIVNGIVMTIVNLIGFGQSLDKAIENPRISHTLIPNTVRYEGDFSQPILKELEDRGHVIDKNDPPQSAVNVALKMNETVTGHSDARMGGVAAVY